MGSLKISIYLSCLIDEVAMECNGQGLFTSLLLQGLRGSAADITGKITPAGIYAFIDQQIRRVCHLIKLNLR